MYHPPFRRRILPWLYVAVFLLVAPILIFYTAGYRYNFKKSQIERNGTLIVDTLPTGASVTIDDKDTGETTPVTFQNILPGWHKIRIAKTGYAAWEKWLEVRPEHVTFANQIWLWKQTPTMTLVRTGEVLRLDASPARDKAVIITATGTSAVLAYWTENQSKLIPQTLVDFDPPLPVTFRWRTDGQAVILNGLDHRTNTWWSYAGTQPVALSPLPHATYHWTGNEVVGSDAQKTYRVNPRTQAFTEERSGDGVVDHADNLTLQTDPKSSDLLLSDRSFLSKRFALPNGNWRFGDFKSPYILLSDANRWLAINPKNDPPAQGELTGDVPRWLPDASQPRAVFLTPNEVWEWDMGAAPVLLMRAGEPIIQARWHRGGTSVFIATKTHLSAIELDERSGRAISSIATFDRITDFDFIGKNAFVAGTRNGETGIWKIQME